MCHLEEYFFSSALRYDFTTLLDHAGASITDDVYQVRLKR